jgi:hypothetical protein
MYGVDESKMKGKLKLDLSNLKSKNTTNTN